MADLMREYQAGASRFAQPDLMVPGIRRNSFDETMLRNALMMQKAGIQIGQRESRNVEVSGPVEQPKLNGWMTMAQKISPNGRQPMRDGEMQQFNKRMGGLLRPNEEQQ